MDKRMELRISGNSRAPLDPFKVIRTALGLRKNETIVEFVERRRGELFSKRDEFEQIKGASPEQDETVRAGMAPIAELGKRPDVTVRFWGGSATVRLAEVRVDAETRGNSVPVAPDFRPSYIREHYAEIEAEVRKQVAAYYAENNILAMPAAEKRKRLEKLAAEILEIERSEVEAIFQAREQGVQIAFRPDTDSRALLGIDGPAPKKQRR